ncbi:radical SAM/SPASM domain-containing protein [Elioraea sp.]|uniref:radical SAM/SPASM domain-containing protein n=1 Tax=Elioraea sp. TaxID=2185103 RepID=UPI0025BE9027|nr:radical SAM protein [Elioraea sp.]
MQPAFANPVLETPPKISISITEACPHACAHCYSDCARAPKAGELSIPAWRRVIDGLTEEGFIQAYFEGGEPFAKPGFLDLIETTAPRMMTLVRTKGAGLDAAVADRLAAARVGRVLVDLMGADAATHDATAGAAGAFDQAIAAIGHCVARAIPVDVLVVLTRSTAPQLNAILALAHGLGAERVGILRLYPLGRAKAIWGGIALPLADQMAALAALAPPPGLKVMQSWHPRDQNCCWQAAALNAFGDMIGCQYLREYVNYGNIRDRPYLDAWRNDPLYKQIRSGNVEASCPDCSGSQRSHGGCRSTAFAFHGRWEAPDPFDVTLNDGVDLAVLPDRLR